MSVAPLERPGVLPLSRHLLPTRPVVPLALGLVFFAVSGWFAFVQHLTFHTRARDMGIYVQILWNAAQGRPFVSTLLQENTNHLAEHVAPLLWPLVPLAGLAPDALPLVVLQQLALAACGLPIYLVARAGLGRGPATLVLAGFYLMPAMSRVSLSEFHPVVVAALPVAAGLAGALLGRPRGAALLLLLALLFEEEVAPTLAGLGVLLALRAARAAGGARGSGRDGEWEKGPSPNLPLSLSLIAVAALWAILVVTAVMPGFRFRAERDEASNRALAHYDQVQQDPNIVWSWLTSERGPDVLAALLLPTGGLALLAPEVLLVGLPGFLVLFLQDRAGTYAGHWAGPLLPIVWLATAIGLGRLARRPPLAGIGLAVMLGGTVIAYPLDSYFPGGREFEADHYVMTELQADLRRAVDRIPGDASLVATRRVVPHLAAREELYQFPFTFYDAPLRPDQQRQDFYILDLTDSPTRRAIEPGEADSLLEKRPRYHVERFGLSVLLLSARRQRPEPPEPRGEEFGGTLRLLGVEWGERGEGETVRVRLFWEALRRPEAEPTRVARLLGPRGEVLDERVGRPLDDYLLVRDWERGQVVAEEISLASAVAGSRRVVVGWRQADGQPLAVGPSGAAELELARFERS